MSTLRRVVTLVHLGEKTEISPVVEKGAALVGANEIHLHHRNIVIAVGRHVIDPTLEMGEGSV